MSYELWSNEGDMWIRYWIDFILASGISTVSISLAKSNWLTYTNKYSREGASEGVGLDVKKENDVKFH